MHKILLAILLFLAFFFSSSEVLAVCDYCPSGVDTGTGLCAVGSGRSASLVRKTPGCPPPQVPNTTDPNDASCSCVAPAAPAAPAGAAPGAPAAPAAAGTPTSGGGQRCYLTADNKGGTPIPIGQVPIAGSKTGIYTAIGCIPTEPKELVEGLLKFAVLAAGGIAFLLMILGALGMITAEGNPEAIKNSQERFYSAIIGLLLIIFSVLLMQVIGVDVLGLPKFNR